MKKGSAIDIPAEVKGLPLPSLQWVKDDVVIKTPVEDKLTMETEEVRTFTFGYYYYFLSEKEVPLVTVCLSDC